MAISFKKFLSSGFNFEKLKIDCAPFLEELKGSKGKHLLYRGIPNPPKDWEIIQWIERKGPLHSTQVSHDLLNSFFVDKFGVKARNWQFATGNPKAADIYSIVAPVMVIFPIGNVEWLAGDDENAKDIFSAIGRERVDIMMASTSNIPENDLEKMATQTIVKKLAKANWWHNQNLLDAIKSQNEIMFKCDKYYAFNVAGDTFNSDEFKQFLKSI